MDSLPLHCHTAFWDTFRTPPTSLQLSRQTWLSSSSIASSPFSSLPSSELQLLPHVEMSDISPTIGYEELTTQDTITDYDHLWKDGYVYVPEGKSWPDGMYVHDMA